MAEEEKKNIFSQAIDKLTSRDEEAALAEAQEELSNVESELYKAKLALERAEREAANAKAEKEKADSMSAQAQEAAQKADAEAEKQAAEAQKKIQELESQLRRIEIAEKQRLAREERIEMRAQQEAAAAAAAAPKIIAEHTLTSEETLSHLALKYYGHATKPYYMVIYEANKEVIGDNPNRVRKGLELVIPELPEELKD